MIDFFNGTLFNLLYTGKLNKYLDEVLDESPVNPYSYRKLRSDDIPALFKLIKEQKPEDLKYFSPHAFDHKTLYLHEKMPSFLMMGVFSENQMVGYFFLRFFANRSCFVGRLIDSSFRGKGIGQEMNRIMYQTAWRMKFRCLSSISRDNIAVSKAHSKNPYMVILKELDNNYLLVEFLNPENR